MKTAAGCMKTHWENRLEENEEQEAWRGKLCISYESLKGPKAIRAPKVGDPLPLRLRAPQNWNHEYALPRPEYTRSPSAG